MPITQSKMADANEDENSSTPGTTQLMQEGMAEFYQPTAVFYNPVQEFNRDLTIAVITQIAKSSYEKHAKSAKNMKQSDMETANDSKNSFVPYEDLTAGRQCESGIKILEALAASGLRSIRFSREIAGIKEIVTNDFDKRAVELIKKNVAHNEVGEIVKPSLADASLLMYQHKAPSERFDVIDLDPYGTAAPFLDSAVQAIKDDGLLCITCTDMSILCGNTPETCYAKYGSMSLRVKCCHEMALRILLQCVESHANRYSRYIEPLISISADFYIRIFVKVHTGQNIVKRSVTKMSMVYQCTGCGTITTQPMATKVQTKGDNYKFSPAHGPPVAERCTHCNGRHVVGGPIWTDPIHKLDFVQQVISYIDQYSDNFNTSARIHGLLNVVAEELPDVPLYYIADELMSVVHCTPPTLLKLCSAILHAGYKVTNSHAAKNSIKTTAPMDVIWDILRCWVKEHPVKAKRLELPTPGTRILAKEPVLQANFTEHPEANPKSRKAGLLRWQINPESDWGPKPRAKMGGDSLDIRRKKGMQKSKRKREINYKDFHCKRYKAGKCDLGDDCKYSHDIDSDQK